MVVVKPVRAGCAYRKGGDMLYRAYYRRACLELAMDIRKWGKRRQDHLSLHEAIRSIRAIRRSRKP